MLLVVGLIGLALAGSAVAARHPTAAERKAITASVSGYLHMPNSPAAKDNKIVSIAVSTLDARYAAARLVSKSAGPSEMVFHRSMSTWFVVGFGSLLGCNSAPKEVLTELSIGCSPPSGRAWINNCGPLVSAPQSLVLTCADANYELTAVSWHAWGTQRATAAGIARVNDCNPYCAAGHFHSYRITAIADQLRRCGKARYYRRLTIVYPASRPTGIPRRDTHTFSC
jgi:putative component of membrane protein insertase Oxa1/YidC/SpoIIIJ protein YidD